MHIAPDVLGELRVACRDNNVLLRSAWRPTPPLGANGLVPHTYTPTPTAAMKRPDRAADARNCAALVIETSRA